MSAVDWTALLVEPEVEALIELALAEDIGDGDATTSSVFSGPQMARAELITREPTVVCGMPLAGEIFRRIDPVTRFEPLRNEGELVPAGAALARIRGDVRALLTAERCAINFVMRLCGIAAAAHAAAGAVPADCVARVFDTRKTTPGWRRLEKAAVRTGGAENHRFGLFDAVLIKDNHIAAAGSVAEAVRRARGRHGRELTVEVEVDTLAQLDEALGAGPDIILLDNFDAARLREAVARRDEKGRDLNGTIQLEASGGITLDTIPAVARTGVDRISLGALTHTVRPADLSLELLADASWLDRVERHPSLDSTMGVARERATAGAPEGTTIVATAQRQGRGRLGRSWFSPDGAGLWLTTCLAPPARDDLPTLSLVAGVAILEAVHGLGAQTIRLKWPNDLVTSDGHKLAGILLERDGEAVLIGIGLNLSPATDLDLPDDIAGRYVGLDELLATPAGPEAVLTALLNRLELRYRDWLTRGLAPTIAAWQHWDALRGETITANGPAGPVTGIARGLAAGGELRVETPNGVVLISSGEIRST